MRRITCALTIVAALALPGVALAGGWKVVKKSTTSGQYAATTASGTVSHPNAIEVEFVHGSGTVAWNCTKGVSVAEWTKQYSSGGTHSLAHVSGKSSCSVVAEVSGQGKITVEILKK